MKSDKIEARICALEAADKMYRQTDERVRLLELDVLRKLVLRLEDTLIKLDSLLKKDNVYEVPKIE